MNPLQRAHDVLETLDERVRMMDRGNDWARRGFARETRKLIDHLHELLREADEEAWDAFDARRRARRCTVCGGAIASTARAHAKTCSKKCRQTKSRRDRATLRVEASRWGDGAEPRPSPSSVTASRSIAVDRSSPAATDGRDAREVDAAPSLPSPRRTADRSCIEVDLEPPREVAHEELPAPALAATGPETRWPLSNSRFAPGSASLDGSPAHEPAASWSAGDVDCDTSPGQPAPVDLLDRYELDPDMRLFLLPREGVR